MNSQIIPVKIHSDRKSTSKAVNYFIALSFPKFQWSVIYRLLFFKDFKQCGQNSHKKIIFRGFDK